MTAARNVAKFLRNNSALFICDIQEKFRSSIHGFASIVEASKRMMQAAKILDVPIIVTEQYPRGLGSTVTELELDKHNLKPFDKTQFSMCLPNINQTLQKHNISNVILCGIEAHVCVQGTCLDLLEQGYNVHIIADGCSSRTNVNRLIAFERMKQSGAFVTTSESAILGLVASSSHKKFREVQKLIMDSVPDSGLIPN